MKKGVTGESAFGKRRSSIAASEHHRQSPVSGGCLVAATAAAGPLGLHLVNTWRTTSASGRGAGALKTACRTICFQNGCCACAKGDH